jgi:hypothetical protein
MSNYFPHQIIMILKFGQQHFETKDTVGTLTNVSSELLPFLTLPVSVEPNILSLIKNYSRNSTGEQRLLDLSIISINIFKTEI